MTLTVHPRTPDKVRRCSICDDGRREVIDPLLAAGRSAHTIERIMRQTGRPTKYETVLKHLDLCLGGRRPSQEILNDTIVRGRIDFAAAVRDAALDKLEAGELKITTQHGLSAQGLLDKRAEKAADRDLMLNLARLMTAPAPQEVLVGEYTVLDDAAHDG